MAQRKVIWAETAVNQRRLILEYWIQYNQSTSYSLKLLTLSDEKANQIAKNPHAFKKSECPDTHVAALGHFSIG